MRQHKGAVASRRRVPVGLIFSEDGNDAEALKNLTISLWPESPRIDYCRKPLILIRDQKAAAARKKNAADVLAVVKAKEVVCAVAFVIAHQDCDDLEPAHLELARRICAELQEQGVANVIAAAPAWEMEAWWYLWPAAVAAVNAKWRALTRSGNHGMIANVKERLRRDLRNATTRDYEESDARRISSNVHSMGLIEKRIGACNSFTEFRRAILAMKTAVP